MNYRLLNDGEVIEDGDEFYSALHWYKTDNVGLKQDCDDLLRRRPISVGTWIPTKERLPDTYMRTRLVLVQRNGVINCIHSYNVGLQHDYWQELPEPYVPPKPKRFVAWVESVVDSDGVEHDWHCNKRIYESLLGDPPDLDAFLDVVDKLLDYDPNAFAELRAARHGEVGER